MRKKLKLLTTLLLLLFLTPTHSQCPEWTLVLTSQEDVNIFVSTYPNCIELPGSLMISGEVTDISGLSNITSVNGTLSITNTLLTSLDGLNNINSIQSYLQIQNNPNLTDISGIQNIDLTVVNPSNYYSRLIIAYNESLSDCNISNVCSYLNYGGEADIYANTGYCDNKIYVEALCNTDVDDYCPEFQWAFMDQNSVNLFGHLYPNCHNFNGGLYIYYSDVTDLTPLSAITSCTEDLHIGETGVINLEGLNNLTSVGGALVINFNSNLTNLDALSNLTSINGNLNILNNNSLISITGVQNIDPDSIHSTPYIYYPFAIAENPLLSECHVTSVCSYINSHDDAYIYENTGDCRELLYVDALCNIEVDDYCPEYSWSFDNQDTVNLFGYLFPNCHNLSGDIYIGGSVYDLTPLSSLTSCAGSLSIIQTTSLTNLDGLNNLTSIGQNIQINYNAGLTNLDALNNLYTINGHLNIISNDSLTSIEGIQNIDPETIHATEFYYYSIQITANPLLSECHVASVCSYTNSHDDVGIYNNTGDCTGMLYVKAKCNADVDNYCPEYGWYFFDQTDIDLFGHLYPNCHTYPGSLNIDYSNINDLTPLIGLTTIDGNLSLSSSSLASLEGLNNLTSINGNITIYVIGASNLNPLSNINSINGYIQVSSNSYLTDISGLENINPDTIVPESGLIIQFNPELSVCNISNFCTYISNGGTAEIYQNAGDCITQEYVYAKCMSEVDDFCPENVYLVVQSEIDQFGYLYPNCHNLPGTLQIIDYFGEIHDLSPLSNITSVGDNLIISDLDYIIDLDVFSNLISVNGNLEISYNPVLENIDGLENLTHVGNYIAIVYNINLTTLYGFRNVDLSALSSEAWVNIYYNSELTTCNLSNLCEYIQTSGNHQIFGNHPECENHITFLDKCSLGDCQSYTIWDGESWSNGYPDINTKVIINGDLILTASLSACELVLNSGVFTVTANTDLTVNGKITNNLTAANFIIENGGALVQNLDVENTGEITFRKNTTIKHLDYTIWSSPVMGQDLQDFSPNTLANRIRMYDSNPSMNDWIMTSGNFEAGKGYMFRAPNVFDAPYPNASSWTGTFIGEPNNGNIQVSLNHEGTFHGIGNPYVSSLELEAFFDANPTIESIYIWTNYFAFENGNYTGNNWSVVNRELNVVSSDMALPTTLNHLSAAQGFLTKVRNENQVVFNNAMRTANQASIYKTISNNNHKFWLNLASSTGNQNQMLISYSPSSTNAFDQGIDATLYGYSGSALYSLIENNEELFVIQGRSLPFEQTDIVPLGFRATEIGNYTVSLSNFDGLFAEGQEIYLRDKLTQTEHNLKESSYSFVSEAGMFNSRFEVIYTAEALNVDNSILENSWLVYKNNNTFQILSKGFQMKDVMVYDILGRVVYSAKDINSDNRQFDQVGANQVLIVKVITSNNTELTKKVIN